MLKRFYIGRPECPYMWRIVTFPLRTYDEYIEQDSGVCYCGMLTGLSSAMVGLAWVLIESEGALAQ